MTLDFGVLLSISVIRHCFVQLTGHFILITQLSWSQKVKMSLFCNCCCIAFYVHVTQPIICVMCVLCRFTLKSPPQKKQTNKQTNQPTTTTNKQTKDLDNVVTYNMFYVFLCHGFSYLSVCTGLKELAFSKQVLSDS